ncbi:helix-turn-helix domain-containing protein [Endothiovibrio diazotrophicus]
MIVLADHLEGLWSRVEPLLSIRDEAEYDAAVERVETLIERGAEQPDHPLHGLLDLLTALLQRYDERHHPLPEVSGIEMLRYLMESHGLTQSQLPEVGPQSVISELLRGKRTLNLRQVAALRKRFGVSADLFLDD